jgi:exonuclease SbcC
MDIEKIIVDNFASYKGRCELRFNTLGKTISIAGNTGSGKTTLVIDALTFALFGKAYGSDLEKSRGWVVRGPAGKAYVELVFSIDEVKYLVRRSVVAYQNRSESEAALYRVIYGEDGEKITAIARGSREVDQKIRELIHMDYKTFMNTVIVRQGDVSGIVEAKPSDVRRIFEEAFGLDFSTALEKAKAEKNLREKRLEEIKGEITQLKRRISEREEVVKQLSSLMVEVDNLNKKREEVKTEINKLEDERRKVQKELDETKSKLLTIEEKIGKLNEIDREIKTLEENVSSYIKEEMEEDEYRRKYNDRRIKLSILYEAMPQIVEIHNAETILREKRKLQNDIKKELLEIEYEKLINELNLFKQHIGREDEIISKKHKLKLKIDEVKGRINVLNEQIRELDSIRNVLNVAIEKGEITSCPICGADLTIEKAIKLSDHYSSEINTKIEEKIKLEKHLSVLEEDLDKVEYELDKVKQYKALINPTAEKIRRWTELNEKLNEVSLEIHDLEEKINEDSRALSLRLGKTYTYREAQDTIKSIEKEIDEIQVKLDKISEGKARLSEVRNTIKKLSEERSRLVAETSSYNTIKESFNKLKSKLLEIDKLLENVREKLNSLSKEIGLAEGRIEENKRKLNEISRLEEELNKLNKEKENLEREIRVYEIIVNDIFSTQGLPLRLLRSRIREVNSYLQNYARKLLRDIRVLIDLSEDKINFKVIRRVDGVDDEKDLLTYSGGEKTLIGFCIRLALAKALARRIGSKVRFLIVDEGLGPLSKDLRSSILEALVELTNEYDKIIVISHMEDIRDSAVFDSRVNIYKDENGNSKIQIPE